MPPSPSEPVWLGSLQHGAARKELPGAPAESGHGSFQSRPRWCAPGAAISRSTVGHEHKQTPPRTRDVDLARHWPRVRRSDSHALWSVHLGAHARLTDKAIPMQISPLQRAIFSAWAVCIMAQTQQFLNTLKVAATHSLSRSTPTFWLERWSTGPWLPRSVRSPLQSRDSSCESMR